MTSVNKATIIGNITKDPEVRYTASGSAVCAFTVATNRQWNDKASGEKQKESEYHRVVAYDRLAEVIGEYATSGRQMYVEGRLKTRKWADKEGIERYTTEIVCSEMKLLGSRQADPNAEPEPTKRPPPKTHGQMKQERAASFDDADSDIPF